MKKLLRAGLLLFVLSIPACLVAPADSPAVVAMEPSAPAKAAPAHLIYLTGREEIWSDFPKAPALGSAVDEDDLLITLAAQAARTDDQKNEAITDQHYSITLITGVIDPAFATKYPEVLGVLKNAENDAFVITSRLKKENARLRPFVQHPTLVVPLFPAGDYSYPSGHASGSELQARLLGLLFPDRADDLLKRARQVADGRVVAGVHYASDTEAGEKLGDLLFQQLEANPKFKQDLAAAAQKDNLTLK
jgi:acid phosphatase (class A)